MKKIGKREAEKIIEEFFKRKKRSSEETKKIKKLSMSHRIKLGKYRRLFCKKCYSDLDYTKKRISGDYMVIFCVSCRFKQRFRIS